MIKNDKNQKKRGVGLLLGLFMYAFFSIFLLNSANIYVEYSNAQPQTDSVAITNDFEYEEIGELEIEEIKEEQYLLEEDNQGDVEGLLTSSRNVLMGACSARFSISEPQLFCGDGGGTVTENVKLVRIHAPDILFVGAAAPFDNLVLTSNPGGRTAFRNASEIINPEDDYLINMPPLSGHKEKLFDEKMKKEPFYMHFKAVGVIGKKEFDVHPDAKSKCPDVVNGGVFNVKAANLIQDDLTRSVTPPAIMDLGDRDVSARICREDVRTIHLDEPESFLLCSEGWYHFPGCSLVTIKAPEECEDVQGIVIDAPLGSGEICSEEDCSIRYSEAGRILTSPPTWTDDLYPNSLTSDEKENDYIIDDPVILTTPCYVRVGCEVCKTKCIWDLSMWQHTYELEKIYTYPGYLPSMDFDEYWISVEHEIKTRAVLGGDKF